MKPSPALASRENKGFLDKIQTRKRALDMLRGDPVVLEAYAGRGHLGKVVYDLEFGVATDIDEDAVVALSSSRPSWRVYQCDAVPAIAQGLAADVPFNFIDLDPFGSPWEAYMAFWESERERGDQVVVVAHDGMRLNAKMRTSWNSVMADAVQVFGNDLGKMYLQACRWKAKKHLEVAGYELTGFFGFEQDVNNAHWIVVSRRIGSKTSP
jgi:hypothetical protein